MRSSKPHALATWLVEHLISRGKGEALAGDLLEQVSQGRSAAWYWRQALFAIVVDLSNELSILWVAVAFTVVWISVISHFHGRLWLSDQSEAIIGWGVRLPWPVSLIYVIGCVVALNALPLSVGLSTYLGAMRCFSLQRFSRGLFTGLLVLAISTVLGLALLPTWRHPNRVGYLVASLPLFFALLLSMCMERANNAGREIVKISL